MQFLYLILKHRLLSILRSHHIQHPPKQILFYRPSQSACIDKISWDKFNNYHHFNRINSYKELSYWFTVWRWADNFQSNALFTVVHTFYQGFYTPKVSKCFVWSVGGAHYRTPCGNQFERLNLSKVSLNQRVSLSLIGLNLIAGGKQIRK